MYGIIVVIVEMHTAKIVRGRYIFNAVLSILYGSHLNQSC